MSEVRDFKADALHIDPASECARIAGSIHDQVIKRLRRRGVVVGLSGGVDSSVVASLCVRALGAERVLGLFTPEKDSDPESLRLGRLMAGKLGIPNVLEDITPTLTAAGCYRRRDELIRTLFPDYGPRHRSKMVIAQGDYNVPFLVVAAPGGEQRRARLSLELFLGIVAATNMKQRTRKQMEYYHADRLNFAVAGTVNRLEFDQGFFVKNGDGSADIKPIAHLYKSQVYALAEYLDVPNEIRRRPPTTDTYSLSQTQEEFFFSLPLDKLDLCLYAFNQGVSPEKTARLVGLTPRQVERTFRDIAGKRRAARYQHEPPLLVEKV